MTMVVPSTFYSCKDTNEDSMNDLRVELLNQNSTLTDALQAQKEALETELATLQSQLTTVQNKLDGINSCDGCEAKYDDLSGKLTAAQSGVTQNATDIAALKDSVQQAANKVADLQTAKKEINQSIENINGQLTTINQALSGISDNAANITILRDSVAILNSRLNVIYNLVGEDASKLQSMITTMDSWTAALGSSSMAEVVSDAATAKVTAEANETWINNIKALYGEDLSSLATDAELSAAIAQANTDAQAMANNAETLAKQYADQLNTELKSQLNNEVVTLNTKLSDLETAYKAADEAMASDISGLKSKVTTLETTVETLNNELSAATNRITALENYKNSQITGVLVQATKSPLTLNGTLSLPIGVQSNILCAYYGEASTSVKEFPTASKVNNAGDETAMLTEEDLNGTSNFFEMYQGKDFASSAGKVYMTVNPSTADLTGAKFKLVTSQNKEAGIKLSDIRKSDEELTFGYSRAADNGFYEADATLNDIETARLNVSGLKEAAKDVKSYLDKKQGIMNTAAGIIMGVGNTAKIPAYGLQAAYTYTDAKGEEKTSYVHSNYEIAAFAVKPISYNLSIQSYATQLKNKFQVFDEVLNISDFINNYLQDVKSKLNFTFEAPNLNFDFDVDLNIDFGQITLDDVEIKVPVNVTVPFEATAEVVINKTVQAKYDKPVIKDVNGDGFITEDEIKYEEATINVPVEITQEVPVSGTGSASTTVETSVSMKEISQQINEQIIAKIQAQLKEQGDKLNGQFKDLSTDLNSQIGDMLNNVANDINGTISDMIDDLQNATNGKLSTLTNGISSILNRAYSIMDNADYYLQPVMFFGGNQSFHRLGATRGNAVQINANPTILYPTTWFVETINPAYKKFVKVTKTWKNGSETNADAVYAKNLANSAENMNAAFDGNIHSVLFNVDSKCSGVTYEIAYAALDYSGYQTVKKYYVTVK